MSRPPNTINNIRSEADARKQGFSTQKIWLSKIEKAKTDPKHVKWRKSAAKAIAAYESGEIEDGTVQGANLFYANVETISPSIYNSVPVPDLRVRYDERNKAAKQACEVLERLALFDIDQAPFSDLISDAVRKGSIVGEGIIRIRYRAQFKQVPVLDETNQAVLDAEGNPTFNDELESDEVYPEIVPWDRFLRGPGRSWDKLNWICFEHDMTEQEVAQLNPEMAARLPFASRSQYAKEARQNDTKPEQENKGILDTITVYEIWDRISKQVFWVSPDTAEFDQPIAVRKDPYGLKGFFPMPEPLRPSKRVDSMIPQVHYEIHEQLFIEYEAVCRRINALVKQLKVVGLYDAKMAPDFKKLEMAIDGEFFPAQSGEDFEKGGQKTGLNDAMMHWPIDVIVAALQHLVQHRIEVKNQIWEATGVAEVMRGNSNKSKTLGANQMEQEAGTMRLKPFQESAANFSRDIMRLMIEMRARLTPWTFMKQVSALDFQPTEEEIGALVQQMTPQQPPQGEAGPAPQMPPNMQMIQQQAQQQAAQFEQEVEGVVRSPFMSLSIDIETDSTIRADVTRDLEQFNNLITATGTFAQAVGAIGMLKPDSVGPLFKVYISQARKFRLGREGEEALDQLADIADAPPQNPNAPDPQEQQMQQQQMQAQQQAEQEKSKQAQEKHAADIQLNEQKMEHEREKAQIERELAELDIQMRREELELKKQEGQLKLQISQQDARVKQQLAQTTLTQKSEEMQFKREGAQLSMQQSQADAAAAQEDRAAERDHVSQMRDMDVQSAQDDRDHQKEMGAIKAQQASKPKPNGATR